MGSVRGRAGKVTLTSIYLTSLEPGSVGEIVQPRQLEERILYAPYYGPCGLKCTDFGAMMEAHEEVVDVDQIEAKCPEKLSEKKKK